jgi:hypothetical protein
MMNSSHHAGQGACLLSHLMSSVLPEHSGAVRSMSPAAGRNYRVELAAAATWPFAVAMIEGSVTGILAKKAFADTPRGGIQQITI